MNCFDGLRSSNPPVSRTVNSGSSPPRPGMSGVAPGISASTVFLVPKADLNTFSASTVTEYLRDILLSSIWFTLLYPFRQLKKWLAVWISVNSVEIFLISNAVSRCKMAIVPNLGSPAHLLRYWSAVVSNWLWWVWERSWNVYKNLTDGRMYIV